MNAILTVEYTRFLLPSEDGLKVMKLLAKAQKLEWEHDAKGEVWRLSGPLEIELKMTTRATRFKDETSRELEGAPVRSTVKRKLLSLPSPERVLRLENGD